MPYALIWIIGIARRSKSRGEIMRERDRLSLRKFREEYQAEEAAKQMERERPLREAEAQLNETSRELALAMRERLIQGRDPDLLQDASDGNVTDLEAIVSGERETEIFLATEPWFYPCEENSKIIMAYIERNRRTRSITAELLSNVATRMRECGLLKERPEEPTPAQVFEAEVIEQPASKREPKPEVNVGWDPLTGKPKTISKYQMDRMSADEFKRFMRIKRPDTILAGRL
jgi:hypothetical protein